MYIKSVTKAKLGGIADEVLKVEYTSSQDAMDDWTLILPGENTKVWIVCIHGHGSQGDQLYTRQDIRDSWLPGFKANGFGIMTPNLRGNAWMSPSAASDMHDLVNYLKNSYNAEKFIFFSGSMGGTSNLIYSSLYPEDVMATVALSAASDLRSYYLWCRQREEHLEITKDIADAIESSYRREGEVLLEALDKYSVLKSSENFKIPLFLAHGAADGLIPVEQSRSLAKKLSGNKYFSYHEIPEGDHDSPLFIADKAFVWLKEFFV